MWQDAATLIFKARSEFAKKRSLPQNAGELYKTRTMIRRYLQHPCMIGCPSGIIPTRSGLLLRNLSQVTKIRKSHYFYCYLLHTHITAPYSTSLTATQPLAEASLQETLCPRMVPMLKAVMSCEYGCINPSCCPPESTSIAQHHANLVNLLRNAPHPNIKGR